MLGLGINYIVKTDQMLINATKNGYKPACVASSLKKHPEVNVSQTCDRVSYNKKTPYDTWYIDWFLNINKVQDIIKNNRPFFTLRLGLDSDSSVEKIYGSLKEILPKHDKYDDLVGITLGFPKYNSMIFNLERYAGMNCENRNNLKTYKMKLQEALNKQDSPYANLDNNEKAGLEKAISEIKKIREFHNSLYDFVLYTKEPEEINRIKKETSQYKKSEKSNSLDISV